MRKGQSIGIDFTIGTAIFITIIAISIHFLISSYSIKSPFSNQLKNSAYSASQKLARKLSWTIYKIPILVNSNQNIENQKLGFKFNFSEIDPNSFLILKNEQIIPYIENNNSVYFVANLTYGKNLFELIYSKNTTLYKINQNVNFNVSNQSEFFSYPLILLSNEVFQGLSKEKINDFENKNYNQIRNVLGLGDLNYNITIPGIFEIGIKIPDNRETYSVNFPVNLLNRFGVIERKTMVVAIWT